MSSSRILPRLIIILGCAVIGAIIGIALQALLITKTAPEFCSIAKLVAGGQLEFNDSITWREQQQDFYGTIIETVESAEMSRRALERVKALNPDIDVSDVSIRAVQSKGSAIINIIATGSEPKYTKHFLDALLDEFISFRQSIREQAQGQVLQRFLQAVVAKQKDMEDSMEKLVKVRARVKTADTVSAKSEQERLAARLISQRNQRDDLRLELKTMEENDAARAPLQTRLRALESEIQGIESDMQRLEQDLFELRTATEKAELDKGAYDKLFEKVEGIQSIFNTSADYVAVQERATPAFENVEDMQRSIAVGAGGGGLLGALVGLILSFLILQAPKPPQIPTAI
ncbi:MAG: hypothetical protein K9N47_03385 [Prosthecobacter sp.]|uniref:hypothetical protein n=1 Tax=Prosthecobacter sp. TaxID=1965333 RepID=UPI0025CE63FE|nr:hypothetical protein [Prosthecobacter sp.]MCF7785136.1 hypothetical protein [Prosthecobacter sp.]